MPTALKQATPYSRPILGYQLCPQPDFMLANRNVGARYQFTPQYIATRLMSMPDSPTNSRPKARRATSEKPKSLKKLKSSLFSRALSLSKLTLRAGTQVAAYGIAKTFQDADTRIKNWRELLINQTEMLTAELGELKGSLMKAGQQLSVYGEHFFPPEINAILKELQAQSAPLEWPPIENTLKENVPAETLARLNIEHDALSAASLGQVHRAQYEKQELVLKIQYPGVARAINSDLRALRTFLSVTKLLPSGPQTDQFFDEIRTMLEQETDFTQEAGRTKEFYQKLQGDSRYVVPRVIDEFSGPRVLALSYEESYRLDSPAVQQLSQERRNQLAFNFLEVYLKEIFEFKFVQTDPHLGNYGVRLAANNTGLPQGDQPGDQIVLYDFGAVRSYSDEFMNSYYNLIAASLTRDREAILEASFRLKFLFVEDDKDLKDLFFDFCCDMVEPFYGVYDWKNSDLPQRLTKKLLAIKNKFSVRTPPREVIFLDRKMAGVFIVLSVLQAKIDTSRMIRGFLERSNVG